MLLRPDSPTARARESESANRAAGRGGLAAVGCPLSGCCRTRPTGQVRRSTEAVARCGEGAQEGCLEGCLGRLSGSWTRPTRSQGRAARPRRPFSETAGTRAGPSLGALPRRTAGHPLRARPSSARRRTRRPVHQAPHLWPEGGEGGRAAASRRPWRCARRRSARGRCRS